MASLSFAIPCLCNCRTQHLQGFIVLFYVKCLFSCLTLSPWRAGTMSYFVISKKSGHLVSSFIIVWHPRVKHNSNHKEVHKVSQRPWAEITISLSLPMLFWLLMIHLPKSTSPFIDPPAPNFLSTSTLPSLTCFLCLSILLSSRSLLSTPPVIYGSILYHMVSLDVFQFSLLPILLMTTTRLHKFNMWAPCRG